ncbi:MAG: histidine biosynthesis protein [Methylocystis sp.]|nr:histidine biosynthesis protein [Methylocystis sp.]
MKLIPVIDLQRGHVVRAFKGRRHAYRPIVSPLAKSSAPRDVVAAFLRLHPFDTIYIADLDAIDGRGDHGATIHALAEAFPNVRFWVDDGGSRRWLNAPRIDPVIGSESLSSATLTQQLGAARIVLSLDFYGADFVGPRDLLEAPRLWPQRVIAMALAHVGAGGGPDIETLATVKRRAGERQVYAAGGVRGRQDVDALAKADIAGALVASALHDGRLTAADLQRYCE